jgi:uncharacterized protein YfaS (alpha-2-macroglobulin family)
MRRISTAILLIACVSPSACKSKTETPAGQFSAAPAAVTAPAEAGAPPPVKLTAANLRPILAAVGLDGALPTEVAVEFSLGAAPEGGVGNPADTDTVLAFEPPVAGTLQWRSASSLVFTPREPFALSTAYTVRLQQVKTRDGVLKPGSGDAWSSRFKTPPFQLVRVSQSEIDLKAHRVRVQAVFSAPPNWRSASRFFSWRIGGAAVRDVVYGAGRERNVLFVTLTDPALGDKAELKVKLAPGLPAAADAGALAPAAEETLDLSIGDPIRVLAARRKEGSNGHYIDIVCDDDAVKSKRYYYDREAYEDYHTSQRCQLTDADAAEGIHFTPPVKISVAPSQGGFRIFGDFKRGSYAMRIDAGVRSIDGGVLPADYETNFAVPARSPKVSFVAKGRYLPQDAWKQLPIRHVNVSSVRLRIRHVPPQNLVFWMSGNSEEADARTSNVVLDQSLAVAADDDKMLTTWVDMAALLPKVTKGVYQVSVEAYGAHDVSRLLLTDINLIVKRPLPAGGQGWARTVWVWAVGMHSGEPLSGTEIKLIRPSGFTMGTCATDRSGFCAITLPEKDVDPEPPFAVVATRGDDLTYLKFDELKTDLGEANVQGEPFSGTQPYRAALYSDRGVYRPGETAHLAAVVRNNVFGAPQAGLPVEVRVFDPRNKEIKRTVVPSGASGLVAVDVAFADYAATGKYRAAAFVAQQEVGAYGFNVEEFVPERMKVTVTADHPDYLAGAEPAMQVGAQYLFGGSAEGSRAELTCRLAPAVFKPKENAGFEYGVWRQPRKGDTAAGLTLGMIPGQLDAKGTATLKCPALQLNGGARGTARLTAQAAVFEGGSGRSTVNEASALVHPETYYIGLDSGAKKVEGGRPFEVSGVVVDWNGKPVSKEREITLELYRLEGEYNWEYDDDGGSNYARLYRPVLDGTTRVKAAGGKFSVQLTPGEDGEAFLVRAKAGRAETDLRLQGGWSWYYWDEGYARVDQTPRPIKAASLPIAVGAGVAVGKKSEVTVKVPYKGRLLMSVETDHLITWEWLDAEPGLVTWRFTLDAFVPNVYVNAFLVKDPHADSKAAFLPDRAVGVQSVRVEPEMYREALKLSVPAEVRSNGKLKVALDFGGEVEANTVVTVAAVDEGILSLTRFPSPDPFPLIFNPRALGLESFETIGWAILLPPAGQAAKTGGDTAGEPGRVQAVKPVALWSGVVKVPASGKAAVEFDVPQYRGALRVMAVSAGPTKMAAASAAVLVRDPLVVQTTLPRFFIAGDDAQIPVFLTNLTGKTAAVAVSLAASDLALPGVPAGDELPAPVQIIGPAAKSLTLENGKSGTVVFEVMALRQIGGAHLTVKAAAGNVVSREDLDVPFAPAAPKLREVQRVELQAGKTDLAPYLKGWMPTTEHSTFWVTNNPYGESFDHLKYLIRYPYGCIEQTSTSLRPLLFVGNLIPKIAPEVLADATLDKMVLSGIDRLFSMQTPSGGFAYWPGDTAPYAWGTAFASHVLWDAKKLGYPVPANRLDEALDWLDGEVKNGSQGYNHGHGDADYYMLYVLALTGRPNKARILKAIEALPADTRAFDAERAYVLKAALYLTGDRRYEKDLRNPDVSALSEERRNDWTFYSDRRRRGMVLSTFFDLFGRDAAGEALAATVAAAISGRASGWYTTQELVWGVTALGKWIQEGAADFSAPVFTANGKVREPAKALPGKEKPKTPDYAWTLARSSEYKTLDITVEKKGPGKLFAIISSEGVKAGAAWKTGGDSLRLDRSYRTIEGTPIDLAKGVQLGQTVFVDVALTNVGYDRIQNIALVDRFPAGWEVENPRLGRGAAPDWADNLWAADYMNVRDDRLEIFGALERNQTVHVVYVARAVTAGQFTIPPVEAEAMYEPRIWAREAGHRVAVTGPWGPFLTR